MAPTFDHQDDEAITVGWRFRLLLPTGLDVDHALELAEDHAVDVHRLVDLVDHGCPPLLAVRIVAPLIPGRSAPRVRRRSASHV